MKIRLILLFLMTTSQIFAHASSYSMDKNCLKAYDLILQLRLDEARDLLEITRKANPSNNIISYLENYNDFLRIVISEEEAVFNALSPLKKKRISELEKGNVKSPWHLYCQAQVNMQWAFARIKFGEFTTAALELNRSYKLLARNQELFPDFSPNNAALGLLHVLIGSVPDNYKWIIETLSFQGTVKQGIDELKFTLNNSESAVKFPFLKSESIFLLSFITFNFSSNQDDSNFLAHLLKAPQNKSLIAGSPLLVYAASAYYLHNGENDLALNLLQTRPKGQEYYPFHYLDYLTGIAKLNKLDPGASIYFLRFVVNFKGTSFLKSAYQRLAWIELLNNNLKGYQEYMLRVRLIGNDNIDGDKQALKESGFPKPPDQTLLKARLLFDGGYYDEALLQMDKLKPANLMSPREKLEYTYRLARIYHKMGNTVKTKVYYTRSLSQGAEFPFYFAANSALQLGIIYEASGDNETARLYYEKCLGLKYDEYRNSISQKAKAGLSRVK
ncbi:MAG: tetratricopeptide repeat protein [Lentimicrobium sp.]|nr:tetratricopeptide repeat protein [Lentimicrobium sp.]